MPSFKPMSDEEIDAMEKAIVEVLPEGDYDFEVIKTTEGVSKKNNNPMFTLELKFPNLRYPVKDWIMPTLTDTPLAVKKFKQSCRSVGILDKYEAGTVEHYYYDSKKGRASLVIEEFNGKQQNKVSEYLPYEYVPELDANEKPIQTDDSIPF